MQPQAPSAPAQPQSPGHDLEALSADRPALQPVVSVLAPSAMRTRPRGIAPTSAMPRALNVRQVTHGDLTWLDIIHPGEAEIEWLRTHYGFHPLHLDDTLSKIQRPKIDDAGDYTFLVLHFPVYSKLVRVTTPSEVDIFVGPNYIITVHAGSLKPLLRLFNGCLDDPLTRASVLGRSPGYLLYAIVDKLVDYCFPILNKINNNIESIEDNVFEQEVRQPIRELSVIRRDMIAFRRIIKPLIPVIASLERKNRPNLGEEMQEYFGDISDHLSKIWDTLEDYKEVIEGLSDTINSLTSNRVNEIMKVLTIMTVILLPLTLLAGIYGLSLALPADGQPVVFEAVIGGMLLLIVGMLAFFKWRRWI
ncbi:MAG: magnesium transporter CorA family protein [Chloroflexota bacterium]|nr:magnesium transporter CorA family protein [Chloroflexota bacterium]